MISATKTNQWARLFRSCGKSTRAAMVTSAILLLASTALADTWPTAIAVNPETNKIYFASGNSNKVTVIDDTDNITATVTTAVGRHWAIAVNPVTNKIYVANESTRSNNVTVINGADNTTATSHGESTPPFQNWTPPPDLCARDGDYCVKIIRKRLPDAPEGEEFTLIVSSKARILARFPTYGYLLSAFWSPDNRYVAINNRRANAGDYLWVISLGDGNLLKIPADLATELRKEELGNLKGDDPRQTMREVTRRFPDCTEDKLAHDFLFAGGWKSPTELLVIKEFQFSGDAKPSTGTITAPGPDGKMMTRSVTIGTYGPGAPGPWIAVNKVYRVIGSKIALTRQASQTIKKHTHSSQLVTRAWTWGPF